MRNSLLLCLLVISLSGSPAYAKEIIRVGGYPFAPFVYRHGPAYDGVTLALIQALNQIQDEFELSFTPISSTRRLQGFDLHRFDLILFENPRWGWEGRDLEFIPLPFSDGDIMITLKSAEDTTALFQHPDKYSLIAVQGFHYGFANYQNDPDYLRQHYDILLVKDNESSLQALLRKRGKIALITYSYLMTRLSQQPELQRQITLAPSYDTRYALGALLRASHPHLHRTQLEKWLNQLEQDGSLARIWERYVPKGYPRVIPPSRQ